MNDMSFMGTMQVNSPIIPLVVGATLSASQGALAPLTCLGIVTSTGYLAVLNSQNTDGSQTLAAILVESAPNSGSTQPVTVAVANIFVAKGSLIFGGSDYTEPITILSDKPSQGSTFGCTDSMKHPYPIFANVPPEAIGLVEAARSQTPRLEFASRNGEETSGDDERQP